MYLLNMLEGIEKIFLYSNEFESPEEFFEYNDQLNFNAVLNLFGMLGENTGKLSEELKKKYNKIAWREMKDFRNKIVHDYINIDIFIVFSILKKNLPDLKKDIEKVISKEIRLKTFEIEEFEIAKKSFYYKHVKFKNILK